MQGPAIDFLCDELLYAIRVAMDRGLPILSDDPAHEGAAGRPVEPTKTVQGGAGHSVALHRGEAPSLAIDRQGLRAEAAPSTTLHGRAAPISPEDPRAPPQSGVQPVTYASERPLDSTSVYLARRFCTNCCREWGDMELLLDLRARRTGKSREAVFLDLERSGATAYGLCCRKALFPVQHNIDNYTAHAASEVSSKIDGGIPSCLAVTFARPRPRASWVRVREGAVPLRGPITREAVDAMFA